MEKYLDVIQHLEYDESVDSCLVWKNTGKLAGTIDSDGYWVIRHKYISYKSHRVILAIFSKLQESLPVDHINGNRRDNRIENLRCVTKSENARNCKMNKRNSSGHTGITRQGKFWRANWSLNNKVFAKLFNAEIYGEDAALMLAIEFRKSKISELNSIGFNYTDRHGLM